MPPSPELLKMKLTTPSGQPEYVNQMKGLIELTNRNVKNISTKWTTPLETENEGEVTVQICGK